MPKVPHTRRAAKKHAVRHQKAYEEAMKTAKIYGSNAINMAGHTLHLSPKKNTPKASRKTRKQRKTRRANRR